jgi:hypothetical protein
MKITDNGNSIEISGLVSEPDIVNAIQNLTEGQTLKESFMEILLLGSKVKDAVQATSTAQLIERSIEKVSVEFEHLETDHRKFIESLMEKILSLNPNDRPLSLALKMQEVETQLKRGFTDETDQNSVISLVKESVENYLQKRESSITKLLSLATPDPNNPLDQESPLRRLYDHVGEVLAALDANKATKEAAQKTSKKGNLFEDLVFGEIQNIAHGFGDEADDPGKQKKTGTSGNDEGDITVDFKSLGRFSGRLVIECKKYSSKKSQRFLIAELEKGISNRDADYGILVTTTSSYELGDHHPFWEDWDGRRAVLVLQDDDEEIDFDRLRFAFLMAKARVKELKNHGDEATFLAIGAKIRLLREHFGRIKTLKGNMSSMSTALGEANTHVAYLEDNVKPLLDSLTELLEADEE